MIGILLIVLVVLFLLGYIDVSGLSIPNITLFSINNHPVTLWNLLFLGVAGWLIGILPTPFRQIAMVLLVLWVLSVLGIIPDFVNINVPR